MITGLLTAQPGMSLINSTSEIIAICNNDIELVAEYYAAAVFTNRLFLACIIGLLVLLFAKRGINKFRLSGEDKWKYQEICKMEKRPIKHQTQLVLEMFIEHYTKLHQINWSQHASGTPGTIEYPTGWTFNEKTKKWEPPENP